MTTFQLPVAAGGPGGPLTRYLTDPGGMAARLARLLLHILTAWGPAAGPVLALLAAAQRRRGGSCAAASSRRTPTAPGRSPSWPRRLPTRPAPRRCGGT